MKKSILAFVLAVTFTLPVMAQEAYSEKKQSRIEKRQTAYEQTKALVESGSFVFEALWAFPQSGANVNVIGNNNRFQINEGHAKGSMQYFGTAYTARTNYRNQGLVMDAPVENWQVIPNDKRHKLTVRFITREKRENYDLDISISAGGSAVVIVSSSLRDPMRYEGFITSIPPAD